MQFLPLKCELDSTIEEADALRLASEADEMVTEPFVIAELMQIDRYAL